MVTGKYRNHCTDIINSFKWLHVHDNDPNSVMALNLAY